MVRPSRPTLNGLLQEKVGMDRTVFARTLRLKPATLDFWWKNNRLVLNLLISGYQQEVRNASKGTREGSNTVV